jgi:predicted ATP-grasp superfamily ATP-dependent carboligase
LAGENNEIKKIEHLLNDEIEDLLKLINSYDIQRYCERYLDMVTECYKCDEHKKCKNLEDYDDEDLLDEVESRGLNWQDYDSKTDIVTQSDLEEMTELFLNLSPQKRTEVINNLKK